MNRENNENAENQINGSETISEETISASGLKDSSGSTKKKWLPFVVLQIALFIFSMSGICSKMAGRQEFLSPAFFKYFGLLFLILITYTFIWQQVLKVVPLTVAYACKGVAGFYAILWGVLFFGEKIRPGMIFGLLLVLCGVSFFLREELRQSGDAADKAKPAEAAAMAEPVKLNETAKKEEGKDE